MAKINFPIGRLVYTIGIEDELEKRTFTSAEIIACLARHLKGDWGDLEPDDIATNNDSVENGGMLLSVYTINKSTIWIKTEWDRSVTTILLPSEY